MLRSARKIPRRRRGAIIVEFALIVPLLFLIVFGIIDFSRAYAQLNNINSSLREGARYAAAQRLPTEAMVRAEVLRFSSAWANPLDVSKVFCTCTGTDIEVYVTNYPITLPTLGAFLNIAGRQILVSRRVSFKWERAGSPP
jgi:Flp pilus assembly protein TadG